MCRALWPSCTQQSHGSVMRRTQMRAVRLTMCVTCTLISSGAREAVAVRAFVAGTAVAVDAIGACRVGEIVVDAAIGFAAAAVTATATNAAIAIDVVGIGVVIAMIDITAPTTTTTCIAIATITGLRSR